MNTFMWESPFTQQHLEALQSMGVINIPPVVKRLACGEDGMGAMASPVDIVQSVEDALHDLEFDKLDRR
jgi:phosphopantothenoylcysteine decarboxylase